MFSGLFITANREWRYAGGTVEAMLATFDACADQVSAALAGHWRLPHRRAPAADSRWVFRPRSGRVAHKDRFKRVALSRP